MQERKWLLFVIFAACGGGGAPSSMDAPIDSMIDAALDAGNVDAMIDAPVTDAPPSTGPCNPLTQAGCNAGEKCTWIVDQDNPPIGHVGCAPEDVNATPIGGACTSPPAGPLGYDSCIKGAVCLAGVCKQICDVQGGSPLCDSNHACQRYSSFLETGGVAVAGVCDPTCDPLTQEVAAGTATGACGSAIPEMPNKGCYGYDQFTCAPVALSTLVLTDREPPQTNASGNPYLNGCAPGFIPFFYEMTGSTLTLCSGFCAALEIDNTAAHAGNSKGSSTALAKLPMDATALPGNGTCDIGKKGSHESSSCRFIWPYLEDDQGMLPPGFENGPHVDTLGVCFAYALFSVDNVPYPDCATLPPRSDATPGASDDAADWGCQKRASSLFTSTGKRAQGALRQFRIAFPGEHGLVRHTLL